MKARTRPNMTNYQLHPTLATEELRRHAGPERHYIDQLREKGLLIEMGNIVVDADQLVLRTFACNIDYCLKCSGKGESKTFKGSCCTDLQVDLTPEEVARLVEIARMADEKLVFAPGEPIRRVIADTLAGEITEVNEDHELIFRHRDNGSCVMSWISPSGQYRCGINTLCQRLDLPLEQYKPSPCYLFPLHYTEFEKDKYLVSVLSEETRFWIKQHRDVTKLVCLRKPEPGAPPAYVFLKGEIEYAFGKDFYQELDRHARPILEERLAQSHPGGNGRA